MPLAQIMQNQLIEDTTNSIAKHICFNLDIRIKTKMILY